MQSKYKLEQWCWDGCLKKAAEIDKTGRRMRNVKGNQLMISTHIAEDRVNVSLEVLYFTGFGSNKAFKRPTFYTQQSRN